MTSPAVSIIVCTRDRAESLRATLESIGNCEVSDGWGAELLVVDNGSSDHTRAVAEGARIGRVALRYICESRPGKGYAYNTGIRAARGEILLFTDDDVRVPADWVEGMCRPILAGEGDAVAGGVKFPADREAALGKEPYCRYRSWLACTRSMDPARPNWLVGANMALARRVLRDVPQFDVELGPGALGLCEETLFSHQLIAAGHRIKGEMDVAVEHHFDLSRLTRRGFLEIARKIGRSSAYMLYHWEHGPIEMSRWNELRTLAGLWRRRTMRPWDWLGGSGLSSWEVHCVQTIAFQKQWKIESQRPRNYTRHGLVKLPPRQQERGRSEQMANLEQPVG